MKKIVFLTLFYASLFAYENLAGTYKITYGSFLDLGVAKASLEINDNRYKISIEAKTTGLAKIISNGKIERYESVGIIKDGLFIPEKYLTIKKSNSKKTESSYIFDHINNKILVIKIKSGKKFQLNRDFTRTEKEYFDKKEYSLEFYAKDDLLSLFFNFKNIYKSLPKDKSLKIYAVGGNKKDGKINIFIPSKTNKEYKKLNDTLQKESEIKFLASIDQDIFESDNGELLLSINKDGFCNKAVLKDVVFFGDIVGDLIELK